MDSFVNGFRHFIARRGVPAKVYSDNGTNIVSGEKEMRLAFRDLMQCLLFRAILQQDILSGVSFLPPPLIWVVCGKDWLDLSREFLWPY